MKKRPVQVRPSALSDAALRAEIAKLERQPYSIHASWAFRLATLRDERAERTAAATGIK